MTQIKYSVIIPVYNAERTLKRCLDSLLGQNREDVEIILINDGSLDGSRAILKITSADSRTSGQCTRKTPGYQRPGTEAWTRRKEYISPL